MIGFALTIVRYIDIINTYLHLYHTAININVVPIDYTFPSIQFISLLVH